MGSQTRSIICLAAVEDVPAIKRIVLAAYEKYIPRIGKPPAPMTDDYHGHVASGNVWVLELDGELLGRCAGP